MKETKSAPKKAVASKKTEATKAKNVASTIDLKEALNK